MGARPSLVIKAIEIVIEDVFDIILIDHSPVLHALINAENRTKADAIACVKKYFVAASMARGCGVLVIIGMIARVLISSPIQAMSQWWLDRTIVVPIARLKIDIE